MKQIRINFLLLLMIGLIGCTKDVSKPNDENEHEAINKLELNFSEPNGVVKSFVVEDADGDGGNPPSRIDTILVKSGKQYSVTVKLYNITNKVIKDVSSTVQAQSYSHEFFFIPTGVTVSIQKTDKDKNGYPVGFQSNWDFSATGKGSILLKLMHKTALKGPNDGPNVGHSDIQIPLPIIIN